MSRALWALTPPPDETVTASADPGLARCAQEVVPAQGLAVTPDGPGAQGSPVSPDRPAAAAQGGRAVRGGGRDQARGPLTTAWQDSGLAEPPPWSPWQGSPGRGADSGCRGVSRREEASAPISVGTLAANPMPRLPGPEGPEPWAPLPPGPPPLRLRPVPASLPCSPTS